MNEQINLRLPQALLVSARKRAKEKGFGTVQAYIEQTVRQDLYEELTPKEMALLERVMKATDDGSWYTEEEFKRRVSELRRKNGKSSR